MSILYSSKMNVISTSLRAIIPIINSDVSMKHYLIHNFILNQNRYIDLSRFYFNRVISLNYGLSSYSSNWLLHTLGGQLRSFYFYFHFMENQWNISIIFQNINHLLFNSHLLNLYKKFNAHSYWSTRYLRRYPCRGQRTRSNGSTSRKLNLLSRINDLKIKKKDN